MTKITKQKIFLDIMIANPDKPMAEVIPLLMAANDWSEGIAVGAYRWAVRNNKAPGAIPERKKAEPKVKAEKPAKEPKPAKEAKPKAEKPAKSPEEIERIKAANLARLKQVHAKRKQNVTVAEPEVLEADPFAAPEALTRDEVAALV